jgi:DNA-binding Xre family transcriptional regulator
LKISPITKKINLTDLSNILDINSQTLTSLFPKMTIYVDARPVLLTLSVSKIDVLISSNISIKTQAVAKIETEGKNSTIER